MKRAILGLVLSVGVALFLSSNSSALSYSSTVSMQNIGISDYARTPDNVWSNASGFETTGTASMGVTTSNMQLDGIRVYSPSNYINPSGTYNVIGYTFSIDFVFINGSNVWSCDPNIAAQPYGIGLGIPESIHNRGTLSCYKKSSSIISISASGSMSFSSKFKPRDFAIRIGDIQNNIVGYMFRRDAQPITHNTYHSFNIYQMTLNLEMQSVVNESDVLNSMNQLGNLMADQNNRLIAQAQQQYELEEAAIKAEQERYDQEKAEEARREQDIQDALNNGITPSANLPSVDNPFGNSGCVTINQVGEWINLAPESRVVCPQFSSEIRGVGNAIIGLLLGLVAWRVFPKILSQIRMEG